MIVAETYRRCSAECMRMCRWEESISDKVLFIEMATKWVRFAELAEKDEPQTIHPWLCKSRRRLPCSCSRSIFHFGLTARARRCQ
jgi:hypothetical protein